MLRILKTIRGQSLIELLVAVAVGAILIGGATLSIEVALRVSSQNKFVQNAAFLAEEELDAVSTLAAADWHKIDRSGADALAGDPAQYYIATTTSPFSVMAGVDAVTLQAATFNRFFTVAPTSRDALGNIEPVYNLANDDPSTEKITVTVAWPGGGLISFVKYVTRSFNNVSSQTDWSGGAGQGGDYSDPKKFDTNPDGNIDFNSQSGSLQVKLP